MQVSELIHLHDWFQYNVVNKGIIDKYTALHQVLQNNINASSQPANQRNRAQLKAYQSELDDLLGTISNVDFRTIGVAQESLLDSMNVIALIGSRGHSELSKASVNSLDLVSFNTYCSGAVTTLNKCNQNLSNLKAQLREVFAGSDVIESDFDPNSEVMLRVHFQGNSSLSNVELFESWGKQWKFIIDHTGTPYDTSSQDVKIVGASKGSVILELIVAASPYAVAFGGLITWALSTINSTLEIRKKRKEMESVDMDLEIKKVILEQLQTAENKIKQDAIDQKVSEISNEVGNLDGDATNKLSSAVRKFFNFIDGGGSIDIVTESEVDEENVADEIKQLRENFGEAKLIQENLKALEHLKTDAKPEFDEDN